jgi:hypothetical protein
MLDVVVLSIEVDIGDGVDAVVDDRMVTSWVGSGTH